MEALQEWLNNLKAKSKVAAVGLALFSALGTIPGFNDAVMAHATGFAHRHPYFAWIVPLATLAIALLHNPAKRISEPQAEINGEGGKAKAAAAGGTTLAFAMCVLAVPMLLLPIAGCAPKQVTPAYKAAVAVDDFAYSLHALQTSELAAYQANALDTATHKQIQSWILAAAQSGKAANAALASGDQTAALAAINGGIAQLENIKLNGLPGIKSEQAKADLLATVTAAELILRSWQSVL